MNCQTIRCAQFVVICGVAVLLTGCSNPKSAKGFTLPEGDAERGQTAFVSLKCYTCHTVADVDLPAPEGGGRTPVALGGKTTRIQTYGELVTSIINPSHKVAPRYAEEQASAEHAAGEQAEETKAPKSPMVNNNDAMSVSQLIDLVKFLQSHYEIEPDEYTPYYPYPM